MTDNSKKTVSKTVNWATDINNTSSSEKRYTTMAIDLLEEHEFPPDQIEIFNRLPVAGLGLYNLAKMLIKSTESPEPLNPVDVTESTQSSSDVDSEPTVEHSSQNQKQNMVESTPEL